MLQSFLVVLVDRQNGRFYRYNLQTKHLDELAAVTDEVPKAVRGASWKGLADDRVARHVDAHVHQHLKRVIHELTNAYHDDALIIGGPEEVVAEFQRELPLPWQERVQATIHPQNRAGIKELEGLVKQAVEQVYTAHLQEMVTQIEESGQPGGRGVQGREPVLEALNLKQVQVLLLDGHEAYEGFVCPKDAWLSTNPGKCPTCLDELAQSDDLRPAVLTKAADQDAEVVSLRDATILPPSAEGMVALKRYA